MQLLFTGTDIWWSQVKNKNKPKKKINEFKMKSKLKNKFCRGGEGRGGEGVYICQNTRTMYVSQKSDNYTVESLPVVCNQHSCKKWTACLVFLGHSYMLHLDIPEDIQLWVLLLLPLHFSKRTCPLTFVAGRVFLHHFRCYWSSCRKHCWL